MWKLKNGDTMFRVGGHYGGFLVHFWRANPGLLNELKKVDRLVWTAPFHCGQKTSFRNIGLMWQVFGLPFAPRYSHQPSEKPPASSVYCSRCALRILRQFIARNQQPWLELEEHDVAKLIQALEKSWFLMRLVEWRRMIDTPLKELIQDQAIARLNQLEALHG